MDDSKDKYVCPYCKNGFSNPKYLFEHVKGNHIEFFETFDIDLSSLF